MAMDGYLLYVTDGEGLHILDAADPANPRVVAQCPNVRGHIGVAGGVLVSVESGVGLRVVDVSTPSSPALVTSYDRPEVQGVALSGEYCILSGTRWVDEWPRWPVRYGFLEISRISMPSTLQRVGYIDWEGKECGQLRVDDNKVYLIVGGGLLMLDIEDVTAPRVIGSCEGQWQIDAGLCVSNGVLYLTDGALGLSILKITEVPAITRYSAVNGQLHLQWNNPAKGMRLQRATSLTNPDWQDLIGSENTNVVSLAIWGGPEFFRLAK